jgi:periplasmic divalent cation tolerance protein
LKRAAAKVKNSLSFARGALTSPHVPIVNPLVKRAPSFAIVLVTAPDLKTARTLARAALEKRLVACANLVPKIESHYWWQGKIERGNEVLIVFKTARKHLNALEKLMLAKHPYDTPEFLVLDISSATERYLDWIKTSTV